MDYREIVYEVKDATALITLSRPDQLNAFTVRMAAEIMDAFDRSDADDDVRAVIVTGAGRAFCAGADLSARGSSFDLSSVVDKADTSDGSSEDDLFPMVGESDQRAPADLGGTVVLRIHRSLKPVIAAINGAAVGVGATMTLPMDIRLSSVGAKFGFVFNRRGISIDGAASWFLPRVVGVSKSLEWINSGRVFGVDEARQAGLIGGVFESHDDLLEAAFAMADEIAKNCSPVSVVVSRRLLWDALGDSSPTDAHRRESIALFRRGQSADVSEGVGSFLDKRAPEFSDLVSTSEEVLDRPR